MSDIKVFHTKVAEIFKDSRGFLDLKFKKTSEPFDLEEAEKQSEIANELMNNEKYCVLIDTSISNITPTKEAQEYLSSLDCKIAEAIVITSLPYRILARLYVKQANNPIKIFKTREKAIKWLLKFIKK